ncbi:MAG: TMEM198/TM7SF3 family protein [Eubacterium sp.]|nr:TMEM198/TM7SF3 family protein [Eubacterium sp.]
MYNYYDVGLDSMDIISGIMNVLNSIISAIAFIIFIIGVIQCFFGYKWLKLVLAVSGFMTGTVIGSVVGLIGGINSTDSVSEVVNMIIAVMVIFGIIGAVISYKVYKLGVFLVGFSGVYVICLIVSLAGRLMSGSDSIAASFITSLIPAIIAGCLMVKFTKPLIIIYTGISGAYTAAFSLASLMSGGTFFFLIAFSVAGIYVQCRTNDGLTEKKSIRTSEPPLKYDYLKNDERKSSPFNYEYTHYHNENKNAISYASEDTNNDDSNFPRIID